MIKQQSLKEDLWHGKVILYGRRGQLKTSFHKAHKLAGKHGARSVCLVVPPDAEDRQSRFSVLKNYLPNAVVNTQGLILAESGQATVIESRDCPTVVIEHLQSGYIAVIHAGRDQLLDRDNPCHRSGVIERLLPDLGALDKDQLNIYITGGISAEHFEHQDQDYVQAFVNCYGQEVLTDESNLRLDLCQVIRAIFRKYGVPPQNIKHDGLCTFKTPWLGSRRAQGKGVPNKDRSNWTLVVKH